jgi:hypothetical protein
MRVDFDTQPVTHHQERRVIQRQRIRHELLKRRIEISLRRFVFPCEPVTHPDIRPATSSACAFGSTFKAVVVWIARLIDPYQLAQVEEMRLRAGALGELVVAPLGYEFCWGHLNGILPVFAKNRELAWQLGLAISFEVAHWGRHTAGVCGQ